MVQCGRSLPLVLVSNRERERERERERVCVCVCACARVCACACVCVCVCVHACVPCISSFLSPNANLQCAGVLLGYAATRKAWTGVMSAPPPFGAFLNPCTPCASPNLLALAEPSLIVPRTSLRPTHADVDKFKGLLHTAALGQSLHYQHQVCVLVAWFWLCSCAVVLVLTIHVDALVPCRSHPP